MFFLEGFFFSFLLLLVLDSRRKYKILSPKKSLISAANILEITPNEVQFGLNLALDEAMFISQYR